MRFKRSGFRPYDRDGMISVSLNKPRRRLWRRSRLVLFAIGAALIAGIVVDRAWLRGNGIVAGELTAVAPIVSARLKRFVVHCLDHVVRGQRLAQFKNEATVEAAAQQLQRLQLGLTQARAQIENAASEAQAARKLVDAEAAQSQQQTAVLKAEDELVKKNYVAVLAWEQAKAAVARADAETRAAEIVYQTKKADQKKAELDAAALQERIESFNASPELTGQARRRDPGQGADLSDLQPEQDLRRRLFRSRRLAKVGTRTVLCDRHQRRRQVGHRYRDRVLSGTVGAAAIAGSILGARKACVPLLISGILALGYTLLMLSFWD